MSYLIFIYANLLSETNGHLDNIKLENVMIVDTEGGIRNDLWEFGYTAINKQGQIFYGIISNNKTYQKTQIN